jgi:hypothetical protein
MPHNVSATFQHFSFGQSVEMGQTKYIRDNHTHHTNALCALALVQVVHIVTTVYS